MNNSTEQSSAANDSALAGQAERCVIRLPLDVARCSGENLNGQCVARNDCRRAIEFADAGPFTLKFEAPTDAPLTTGCELIILPYNAEANRPER